MTNNEKIAYLNQIIYNNHNIPYNGPKLLYKYRPFDEYTFDMLENDYIFLCPAENEDDETECLTTVDYENVVDLTTNNLKWECVNQIIDYLKPYTSTENFEIVRNMILSITRKDGTIPPSYMLDLSFEMDKYLSPGTNTAPFINWITSFPEILDKPEISDQLKMLFINAYNARKETGICSFAESNDIDYMWNNYAAESTGYCIEYDLSEYELAKSVLPVIYQEERETNIIIQLVASYLGQMITGFSNGEIQADSSQFIRLFLTKYKKWEYQKEWRFLGYANEKPKSPKIKTIFLGNNITIENEEKIRKYADLHNIAIIKQ